MFLFGYSSQDVALLTFRSCVNYFKKNILKSELSFKTELRWSYRLIIFFASKIFHRH